ncbi:sensor histidine kinase [Arthrobacter sp. zg-Y238]|uniref:sensor histidine kinase n=1 Tax=Arthrobacter sp. zg-Y238 TaxID=2964614 RepID=UPI002105B466|nr:histidine kinase [Arthrobacter sp. zg-Y238]MCQ1953246.1 histidine kinase [Arthrobacter sp. zg-Y238]
MQKTADQRAGNGIWPSGAATAAGYLVGGTVLELLGVNAAGLFPPIPGAPGWAWVPVLVLGCAGLLFRRRNVPLMLAVTGTATCAGAVLGGGIITYLLLFEVLYAGILFGSPRVSRGVQRAAVTGMVVLPVSVGLVYREWPYLLFGLFQAVFVCLVPLWWAGSLRRQTERAERERQRAETERLRAERTAQLAELRLRVAVASERGAMARELHDAIAGHLSAIALQSGAALAARDAALDHRVLAQVRAESVSALQEMRSMIDLLQSDGPLDGREQAEAAAAAGGLGQLESLAASARLAGSPVELDLPGDVEVPVLVGSSVYRIVQESLANAVRHAPGCPVSISVRLRDRRLELSISNALPASGGGSSAAAGNGSGLRNMNLRAAQLGGTFSAGRVAGSSPGQDLRPVWLVEAALPIEDAVEASLLPRVLPRVLPRQPQETL